jgi:N-acetylmuramoyl-L-alanine amidase
MTYKFQQLPQLVDKRGKLPSKGSYNKRAKGVKSITTRVWHHSLTKLSAGGSNIVAFANFHVGTNGWPEIAYHLIIDPNTIINGKAVIYYSVDISKRSYHVGNSNTIGLGICVIGDYRTDKLSKPTIASIIELRNALIKDGIGKYDKSHNEMPGYSWKACCVYDYNKAFKDILETIAPGATQKPSLPPDLYTIQEGDTFWSIAEKDGPAGITVNDLIAANPGVEPTKLKVGQTIKLGKSQHAYTPKPDTPKQPQSTYRYPLPSGILKKGARGDSVRQLQNALASVHFYPNKNAKNQGVDGIFGADTENALRRFQMVYVPYQVDGVYGPNTKSKLQAVLKSKVY